MQSTDLWPEQCPKLPSVTAKVYSRRRNRPATADKPTDCPGDPASQTAACTTLAPVPRTVSQPAGSRRPLTQLHLDLGQSNFTCITCRVCGMTYAPGQEADEKLHRTYHSSALQGLRYQAWHNERVIWRDSSQGRIIFVLPSDPAQQQKKVQELYAFLEAQLELSSGWLQGSHAKVLMYVSNNRRIIGALVTEAITTAYPCVPRSAQPVIDESEHMESSSRCDNFEPATMSCSRASADMCMSSHACTAAAESSRQMGSHASSPHSMCHDDRAEALSEQDNATSAQSPDHNAEQQAEQEALRKLSSAMQCSPAEPRSAALRPACPAPATAMHSQAEGSQVPRARQQLASTASPACATRSSEAAARLQYSQPAPAPTPCPAGTRPQPRGTLLAWLSTHRHAKAARVTGSEGAHADGQTHALQDTSTARSVGRGLSESAAAASMMSTPCCSAPAALPSSTDFCTPEGPLLTSQIAIAPSAPPAFAAAASTVQCPQSKWVQPSSQHGCPDQQRHGVQRAESRTKRARQERLQGRLDIDETQPQAAGCGVRVVWVSSESRRRGVATSLLNAARANCIPGYIVPRHELAFSQPTEAGRHLASSYTGADSFLVYKCDTAMQAACK